VGEVAGVRDLLGDAANEVCVDPRDTQAFASAILATLDDPANAQERARMIRLTAAGRVDWQVIADGYAGLLEGCVRDVVAKGAQA
jgi:glycosyltransferase involved in cell wall biosynthesis